jgi:hypothetical protein
MLKLGGGDREVEFLFLHHEPGVLSRRVKKSKPADGVI